MSPCSDSESSGVGCAASDAVESDLRASRRDWGAVLELRSAVSVILDLLFSLSLAFSLAARGAAGKNWEKVAPDALGAMVPKYLLYTTTPTIHQPSYLLESTIHVDAKAPKQVLDRYRADEMREDALARMQQSVSTGHSSAKSRV